VPLLSNLIWYSRQDKSIVCVQAVMYFRRALKLDRHYLSAWTLMGHEYVEMKNTSAAIGDCASPQQVLYEPVEASFAVTV